MCPCGVNLYHSKLLSGPIGIASDTHAVHRDLGTEDRISAQEYPTTIDSKDV